MRGISLFSFLLLIHIQATIGCELKGSKDFISLSGPMTYTLKMLGLLKDKKLKGVSVFNPIDQQSFPGKVYGGGLFLAQKSLSDFENKIVFYDSSRELKRYLKQASNISAIEIKSRGKGSLVVAKENIKKLTPYLKECSEQLAQLRAKVQELEETLKKLKKLKKSNKLSTKKNNVTYLFYLGAIRETKRPNLLVVNDGPVKTLVDYKVLKSYPSELEYVSWSQKFMQSLKAPVHIGLSEGPSAQPVMQEIAANLYNISYKGILTPGLSQLLLIEYLIQNSLVSL